MVQLNLEELTKHMVRMEKELPKEISEYLATHQELEEGMEHEIVVYIDSIYVWGAENKFDRALAETLLKHYHQRMLNKNNI